MADNRFVELIFEPSAAKSAWEFAYKSLAASPQQLFSLFLRRDPGMEFASAFPLYAKRLADLLLKAPERFNQLGAKEKEKLLYEETVGAFIFTLLPWMPNDAASQEAVGDIVMAFVQTSRPERGGIELLGAELGRAPAVVRRLISSGQLASHTRKPFFDSLVLENWESWTAVAGELSAKKCDKHRLATSRKEMTAFIRSFPCDKCSPGSTESQTLLGRANTHGIGHSTRVFENLLGERLGPWKMVISALAVTSLKENVTEDQMSHIRQSLLQLASGEWAQSCLQRAPDREPPYRLPVYMIECSGYAIMWQVDGAFDELYYRMMQVLKVWAICTLKEVDAICYWIAKAQQAYTEDQISACDVDCPTDQMHAVFPSPFHRTPNDCTDFTVTTADPSNEPEKCTVESSPLLGKFFSLTTTVLENRHRNALFPVDPSMEEVHIINHSKSTAFILARSGTGKTTCLVYKLVSRYLASRAEGEVPVRQLLLTRSSGLAKKLKGYTQRLIDTRLGTIGGDSASDEQQRATPDHDERPLLKDLLSLKEEDFPLVCTFDHFLRLVENSIRLETIKKGDYVGRISAADFRLVDSTLFGLEYWKRFPITLTRKIPKELAFMDIMGVIKGTASMETKFEPLSCGSYCGKRWSLAPNFKSQERATVYSLYERYESIKKKRGEIDDADRVMRVLKALETYTELRKQVVWLLQEVYVDEVQDQRQIEIELLLTLVPDPRGIHFAGDTAQSISKDSLFRFENAKALFYTQFKDQFSETGNRRSEKSGAVPMLLRLSHNYRSHEGIISVASVIMDLLYGGFPQLVDELSPEVGDHAGPVPILYIGRRLLQALQGAKRRSKKIDEEVKSLGEPRVILVRDEKMCDELRPSLDESTLIMTILESKGMEFEDVILYDFFSTSPYNWDYRILEDIFVDYHVTRHNEGSAPRAAPEKVDIVLCSELKHLYVAITRTRGRLWIVESKEPDLRPIIYLFNRLAQKCSRRYSGKLLRVLRDDDIPDIRKLSAQFISAGEAEPSRWRELGFRLMEKKDYSQAAQCFRNSGDQLEESLACAYMERLTAYRLRAANSRDACIETFGRACDLFLKAGRVDKAVECQVDAGNLLAAAKLLSKHGKPQDAAWMFVEAGSPKLALGEYVRINDYEKTLATHFQSQLFTDVAKFFAQLEKKGKSQPTAWMLMDAKPPRRAKNKSAEMDGDEEALASRLCADVAAVFAQLESLPLSKRNCRKQYARLLYLLLSPRQSALNHWKKVWMSIGPMVYSDLVSTARKTGKLDYVVEMFVIRGRYQEACVLAANVGLVREAYSLFKRHGVSLRDSELTRVINYIHAQQLCKQTNIQSGGSGKKVTALESQWQRVANSLAIFSQKGKLPDARSTQTVALDDFLTLQIAKSLPKTSLQKLPNASWGVIDRAVDILRGISAKSLASSAVLLLLGIYPTNDGKYIALPYSPPEIGPKIDFPLSYYTGDLHSVAVRYVLDILDAALAAVDRRLCQPHVEPTRKTVISGPKVITQGQSAAINSLLRLHQKFAEISGVCSQLRCTVPGNYRWYFWKQSLRQRLTFTSSCEQDPSVIAFLRQELSSPAFGGLRSGLQELLLSAAPVVASKGAVVFDVLSEILDRMRSSEILGIEDLWYVCCVEVIRCPEGPELAAACQIVACIRAVRASTTADDFPGPFSEKMNKLLCRLEDIQGRAESRHLFHSASVLSVYEELVILLLFLSRPEHFALPSSWIALHPSLRRLAKIPRFDSKRETYWYQRTLARVIIMLCRLIMRVEGGGGYRTSAADRLARRGVLIICIAIINLQELKPPPIGYHSMLREAQKVFGLKSLRRHTTEAYWNCPPGVFFSALSGQLAASGCYRGKEYLQVVLTNNSFCSAKLPIFRPGFSQPVPRPEVGDSDTPDLARERLKAVYTFMINYSWWQGHQQP